jgi:hypothetical protein
VRAPIPAIPALLPKSGNTFGLLENDAGVIGIPYGQGKCERYTVARHHELQSQLQRFSEAASVVRDFGTFANSPQAAGAMG